MSSVAVYGSLLYAIGWHQDSAHWISSARGQSTRRAIIQNKSQEIKGHIPLQGTADREEWRGQASEEQAQSQLQPSPPPEVNREAYGGGRDADGPREEGAQLPRFNISPTAKIVVSQAHSGHARGNMTIPAGGDAPSHAVGTAQSPNE